MTETKQWGYIDINRLWLSSLVVLLFTSIHLTYLIPVTITSALYYVLVLVAFISLFCTRGYIGIRTIGFWGLGAAVLSILNMVMIGNQNLIRTGILLASFFLAVLLLNEEVDEKAFSVSVYVNALLIVFKILQQGGGVKAQIYEVCSNNYVSILLLSPAVIYYAVCNARNKNCSILPICCTTLLSFMMGGRGGVLSTGILLVGVFLHKYFRDKESRRDRVILGVILCAVIIPIIVYGLIRIFSSESDLYIVDRINRRGMEGGQRLDIWAEYLTDLGVNWKYFMFGVDQSIIYWAMPFGGNLHNSYLFVHAYLGIIGFVVFICMILRAAYKAVRARKWLYFCTLLTFCFRGTTDHVFGSNRITVVILALIFLPDLIDLSGTGSSDNFQKGGFLHNEH